MTNSTREKLAEVIYDVVLDSSTAPISSYELANAQIAAIITALPGMVELEWADRFGSKYVARATTILGNYDIRINGPEEIWLTISGNGLGGRFKSREDAQTIAQDHYSKQIMKALGL